MRDLCIVEFIAWYNPSWYRVDEERSTSPHKVTMHVNRIFYFFCSTKYPRRISSSNCELVLSYNLPGISSIILPTQTCRSNNLSAAKRLAILNLLEAVLLEADGVDLNETSGVHGGESLKAVHRRVLLRVEVAGIAGTAEHVGRALVAHHADLTGDVLLTEDDGVLNKLTLLEGCQ